MPEKIFVCSAFQTTEPCTIQAVGEEAKVIDDVAAHLVAEHGYEDTPALRADIASSLEDYP